MISKTILVCLLLIVVIGIAYPQQDQSADISKKTDKANEILQAARKAFSKKTDISEVKSLTIISTGQSQLTTELGSTDGTNKIETNFIFPDKIHRIFDGIHSTNSEITSFIVNGELVSYNSAFYTRNGEKINFDYYASKSQKELRAIVKRDAFFSVFPITLDSSWFTPLEFSYIGIAESKDGKANVLEAVSTAGTKYRLFFDVQTNLLLMMIVSRQDKDKTIETKYFYSDYKEMDGLLVASKIVIRNNLRTEEILVKTLKVNPKFKDNFYDVKK